MITMTNSDVGLVPAVVCPEVLSDFDDVRKFRDALFEMLETVLSDEDLTYCTPNSHLYIVANVIRVLTKDIEKEMRKGGVG